MYFTIFNISVFFLLSDYYMNNICLLKQEQRVCNTVGLKRIPTINAGTAAAARLFFSFVA
jgi:hypothetical protein